MNTPKLVIGITGTIASGKGTVVQILKDKGFSVVVLSDLIKEYMIKNGIELVRKNIQDTGNLLRQQHGGQILAQWALEKNKSYSTPLIVDGVRNLDEIKYLKNNSKFTLIGIDAPFEVRWERVRARNKDSDLLNHDKFVIDDARDRGFNEPLNGQQNAMCLVQADFLINNDEEYARLEDSKLYKEVMEIYKKIMKQ